VSKSKPLPVPGLSGGEHVITAVRKGYEPEVKHILVAPGEQRTVMVKIRYPREIKRSAIELYKRGSDLLYSKRSGFNPLDIYLPRQQNQADIRRARDLFTQALAEDPHYSQAAYSLGVACQLLSDTSGSLRALKRAVELDPSYVDARTLYAAVLIEDGDPDWPSPCSPAPTGKKRFGTAAWKPPAPPFA
jgi:tetratricopeptide (TPR) repeat protein